MRASAHGAVRSVARSRFTLRLRPRFLSSSSVPPNSSRGQSGGSSAARQSKGPRRDEEAVLSLPVVAGFAMAASLAATGGALWLVAQEDNEPVKTFMSVPSPEGQLLRRFSTSGTAGPSVKVEAFSAGEHISPEALLLRYSFDEEGASGNAAGKKPHMQVIGKGAYGKVVRAVERSTGKPVAMKVVPHTAMTTESLLTEVEILRRVRGGPSILQLYDFLQTSGRCFVVTELCEGGDSLERLITRGPFTETGAAVLTKKVAQALQHIHRCGYVHLDIKPENLVFKDSGVDEVRVIDFGMARKISEVCNNLKMISGEGESSMRVGTMAYWSPEQVRSCMSADGKLLQESFRKPVVSDLRACDMFSLGVVLYIMLLGVHPFDVKGNGDEREMAKAILKGTFSFDVHGDKLRLSRDAKDLLAGLLHPDPSKRYTPKDVLAHPFVLSKNPGRLEIETLPTSWTEQGYVVNRDDKVDKLIASSEMRLKPFAVDRMGEAFIQAVLMASTQNGRRVYMEEHGHSEMSSDDLFRMAFNMFESGDCLTVESAEELLQRTGDEDDVLRTGVGAGDRSAKSKAGENKDECIDFEEFKAFLRKLNCVTRSFLSGQVIFAQGSVPQGLFVLLKGEARLEYRDESRQLKNYAGLRAGTIFGEVSLLKGSKTRSSTIRCTQPSEVLFIPKEAFLKALAGSPALKEILFGVTLKQQTQRLTSLFEFLKPKGVIVKDLAPGEILFKQGDPADFMYVIKSGYVGSNSRAPSSRAKGAEEMAIKIAERGPGDLIGTSAATGGGGMRYSTAQCLTPVKVVGYPLDELTRLRRHEPLNFYLEALVSARKEYWQAQLASLERGVSEVQLLPVMLENNEGITSEPAAGWRGWVLRSKQPGMSAYRDYQDVLSRTTRTTFKAGDVPIVDGERAKNFYIIESGTVSVEYVNEKGEEIVVSLLGPGDHFGENLLEGSRSTTKMRCVSDATIMVMNKDNFFELLGNGETSFGRAVKYATRIRLHRWSRNLLKLARQDDRHNRRQSDVIVRQQMQEKLSVIDSENDGSNMGDDEYIDRDTTMYDPVSPGVSSLVLQPGDVLFRRGDSSSVYIVHRGEVALSYRKFLPRTLVAGDTIGFDEIANIKHRATAICTAPNTIVSRIPRETLESLADRHDWVSEQLHRHARRAVPMAEVERRSAISQKTQKGKADGEQAKHTKA